MDNKVKMIAKPTDMIRIYLKDLNVYETKLFNLALRKVQETFEYDYKKKEVLSTDEEIKEICESDFTLKTKEILEIFGTSASCNPKKYKDKIEESFTKLKNSKIILINNQMDTFNVFYKFSSPDVRKSINFQIDKMFLPYYREFMKRVTIFDLKEETKITSTPAIKLYELLRSFCNVKEYKCKYEWLMDFLLPTISNEDSESTKKEKGKKQYLKRHSKFISRVIEPSIKEINKKTNLSVKYEENEEMFIFYIKRDDEEELKERKRKKEMEWVANNPPSIEEVEKYIEENDLNVDVKKFVNYWNEKKWTNKFGTRIKDWKKKIKERSIQNDDAGNLEVNVCDEKLDNYFKKQEKEKLEEEIKRVKDTMTRYEKDNNTESRIYQNCKKGIVQLEEKLKEMKRGEE